MEDPLSKLEALFIGLEGQNVAVRFIDGDLRQLKIISVSHVALNGTVWGVPVQDDRTEVDGEPGIEFLLEDVAEVRELGSRRVLYPVETAVGQGIALLR